MQALLAASLIASFQPAAAPARGCGGQILQHAAYTPAQPAPCCRIGQGCAHFLSTDTIIRGPAWSKT